MDLACYLLLGLSLFFHQSHLYYHLETLCSCHLFLLCSLLFIYYVCAWVVYTYVCVCALYVYEGQSVRISGVFL